jgi:hypothetical protein
MSEAWSEFVGSKGKDGTVVDRAECAPGRFISTIQMSLVEQAATSASRNNGGGNKSTIAVGSLQGYCDDGALLPRQPRSQVGGSTDVFFLVKTDGFVDFVGASSREIQSLMFVGQEQPEADRFSLSCPFGLRLTGYQAMVTSVVHAVKFKCSRI